MNSPARDVAEFLESLGLGSIGTDLFVGEEPAAPDSCITIYDYAGDPQDTDELDDQPRFQVRVRDPSYSDSWSKQAAVKAALTKPKNGFTSTDSLYPVVMLINEISSIGRDGNRRNISVANYRARREIKET